MNARIYLHPTVACKREKIELVERTTNRHAVTLSPRVSILVNAPTSLLAHKAKKHIEDDWFTNNPPPSAA